MRNDFVGLIAARAGNYQAMTTSLRSVLATSCWLIAGAVGCGPADAVDPMGGAAGTAPAAAGMAGALATAGSGGGSSAGTGGASTGGSAGSAGQASPADGCDPASPHSLFCEPLQTMPKTLAPTGLFPAAPDLTQHAKNLLEYAPFPALWSDGLEKQRFLLLPMGKQIDDTNPKSWVFPVGTILVKTFFDDSGTSGARRPIETRVIRRVGTAEDFTEYDYYLYQWNTAGTDADLVVDDRNGDSAASKAVKVTINHMADGKPLLLNAGQPFDHTLPSRDNCGDCHHENGNAYQTFIGFDEVRLNHKLTPDAAMTQLAAFHAAGIFTQPAPAAPRSIVESNPTLLKVKEFALGNCVHCHNEKGKVFDLAPEVFVAHTVGQATSAQSVQPPAGWLRVVPGQPEMSVLFVQARRAPLPMATTAGADRLRPMPPIGVNDATPDPDGLSALKTWIESLPN